MYTKCTKCNIDCETKTDQSLNPKFCCKKCLKQSLIPTQPTHPVQLIQNGLKVVYGWNYFFLPDFLRMNDVQCDKCMKRFLSDSVPTMCNKCTDNTPTDNTCTDCGSTVHVTPKAFAKHENMCLTCFNIKERPFVCQFCKKNFQGTHQKYNNLGNISVCDTCIQTVNVHHYLLMNYHKMQNDLIDSILGVIPTKKVTITYSVTLHVNGCDYHGYNIEDEVLTPITRTFPYLDRFDFDDYYSMQFVYHDCGCTRETYDIIDVVIHE